MPTQCEKDTKSSNMISRHKGNFNLQIDSSGLSIGYMKFSSKFSKQLWYSAHEIFQLLSTVLFTLTLVWWLRMFRITHQTLTSSDSTRVNILTLRIQWTRRLTGVEIICVSSKFYWGCFENFWTFMWDCNLFLLRSFSLGMWPFIGLSIQKTY